MTEKKTNDVVVLMDETAELVNPVIERYVHCAIAQLISPIELALKPKGSGERALLTRLSWELGNQPFEPIISAAAAIELLHFSTLVLDDLLDRSPLRGGNPTVYKTYGQGGSVVVGEILGAYAVRALLEVKKNGIKENSLLLAVDILEQAKEQLYYGQWLDLIYEKQDNITEEGYFRMIDLTTGALTEAAVAIGALLRDADVNELKTLCTYGRRVGVALQVRNDLSELIGDPGIIGKPLGEDLRCGKKRLPWIYALNNVNFSERKLILEVLGNMNASEKNIAEVIGVLERVNAIDYCDNVIRALCDDAKDSLSVFSESVTICELVNLAEIVADVW